MVLVLDSSGSLLMDGTEQNLFSSQTILAHYSTKIFFHNLVANDKITVKVYDNDEDSSTERLYRTIYVVGVQDDPVMIINWIPSNSYRVTCEQTDGTNKTITWSLWTA